MKIDKTELYTLLEIVEKLKFAKKESDIHTSFALLNRIIPFNAILACKFNRKKPNIEALVNSGFENSFLDEYNDKKLFLEDHVLSFCIKNIFPCTWTQVRDKIGETNKSLILCDLTQKYGYNDGVSFAIKDYEFGLITYLVMAIDTNSEIKDKLALVTTITPFIHFAFDTSVIDHNLYKLDIKLTTREKEVFKWIAEGKTQWEVSRILSVSERTVRFHITSVTRKLNVTNCTHAVAKLISENMLY